MFVKCNVQIVKIKGSITHAILFFARVVVIIVKRANAYIMSENIQSAGVDTFSME